MHGWMGRPRTTRLELSSSSGSSSEAEPNSSAPPCVGTQCQIVKSKKREEQIGTRQDESQWIVAQRPLSAPTIPRFDWIVCPGFPRSMMWTSLNTDSFNGLQGTCDIRPKPFTFVPVLMERKTNTAYQHGF